MSQHFCYRINSELYYSCEVVLCLCGKVGSMMTPHSLAMINTGVVLTQIVSENMITPIKLSYMYLKILEAHTEPGMHVCNFPFVSIRILKYLGFFMYMYTVLHPNILLKPRSQLYSLQTLELNNQCGIGIGSMSTVTKYM